MALTKRFVLWVTADSDHLKFSDDLFSRSLLICKFSLMAIYIPSESRLRFIESGLVWRTVRNISLLQGVSMLSEQSLSAAAA
jgi:hypothetical protein